MAFLWNKGRTGCYPGEQMDNQKPDGGTPGCTGGGSTVVVWGWESVPSVDTGLWER